MRIRLKCDLLMVKHRLFMPLEHGLFEGKEFDVLEENGKPRYEPGAFGFAYVMTDAGVEIKVWGREFEIVEEDRGPRLQT